MGRGRRSLGIALIALAASTSGFAAGAPNCDAPVDACAARACRIDAEIARAKAQGNSRELGRLEKERSGMEHCNDDGLKQKRAMALEQAQQRIDRRTAELKEAEAGGDAAKIKKAERRLESARAAFAKMQQAPL